MMQKSFEPSRKAMESCIDLFQNNLTASLWFASSDLNNKKMQNHTQQNIATACEFAKRLAQAKDFSEFWQIQSKFMEAQWKAFGEQMKDLTETVTKNATGARKEFSS